MAQDRNIKYVGKEFGDFKNQLIDYTKNYFPDTHNDFSETSPGMMFMEMAAYVGDILSFYQDTQLQETFLQYAKEPSNLYSMAYMMGYRPKTTTSSKTVITVSQLVGADPSTGEPNYDQAIYIAGGAVLTASAFGQEKFYIEDSVDFSFSGKYSPTEVGIEELDPSTGEPTLFTLTKKVEAVSGELNVISEVISETRKFTTLTVPGTNIIGIVSIVDENDNEWYEVPFLGQDTVYVDTVNTGTNKDKVPSVLSLQKVPRRFVSRLNANKELELQFGAGIVGGDDTVFTPDPTNVGLGDVTVGISKLDKAYDPSNFLYTKTYGLSPAAGTTLTITYLTGGGVKSNVPANSITTVEATKSATDNTHINSVLVNNESAATGGRDGDTIEELRQNALRSFAEQGRTVTLQDYTVRAMSMPAQFGSIAKVFVTHDELSSEKSTTDSIIDSNPLALSMYVLAYDRNSKLVSASPELKNNLKTYLSQYMLLTDAINIKDTFVVNFGVDFDILVKPNYNSRDILLKCTEELKDHFKISKWNINQPINLSTVYSLLDRVRGVQTVQKVEIVNKVGAGYTSFAYDIKGATRHNVVYPSYDTMVFELKNPDQDIKGRTTTL